MKIGVIGTGNVGCSVAGLLGRAGHEIRFGARDTKGNIPSLTFPVGTIAEAAGFGEVLLCAAPYGAWPVLAGELAPFVAGRVVIDAANPSLKRDGAFAQAAIDAGQGAGVPVAKLLPGAKLVRAFNAVPWPNMVAEAHRAERVAIPLAGDDEAARKIVAQLVCDAGFDPVDVGPLSRARWFDPGSPAYNNPTTAVLLREKINELDSPEQD